MVSCQTYQNNILILTSNQLQSVMMESKSVILMHSILYCVIQLLKQGGLLLNHNYIRNMMIVQYLLVVLLPLVTCWWDVGHMLTAAIAEMKMNELDPYASVHFRDLVGSINQLCDNRSRTFIESASWPDDIKGKQYGMNLFDPWHFKDSPYVYDTVVPIINYTESAVNSLQIMATATKTLSQQLDRNSAQRALFARYVVHLLGDIHQPLHSVTLYNLTYPKGDIGGNALKVQLVNGSTSNFHSFWDAGAYLIQNDSWHIDRPMNMQNLTALKAVATSMVNQYGKQVEELGKIIDPAVWAQESFRIAQNTTYPYLFTTNKLNSQYTNLVYETCKKRITLAGYRLANYVINIFKAKSEQTSDEKSWMMFMSLSPKEMWKAFAQDSRKVNVGTVWGMIKQKVRNIRSQ